MIYAFVAGSIPLGTGLVFYLTLFRNSQGTFQGLFDNVNRLFENGLFMDNLFSFLKLTPQMPVVAHPQPMPRAITQGLEFRHVWFQYPGREDWALRDLNLTHRLFRYPCSYLIDTAAFDGLPGPVKDYVLRRLWEVLSGKDTGADFAHLSAADRRAILKILRDTKPGLPDYWQQPGN